MMVFPYSPPQRLEANELPLFADVSGRVAAVVHRNFIVKLSSSHIFSVLRAGWYEQADINFPSLQISTLGRKSEVVRYDYYYDYNYRSFFFFKE